MRSIDGESSLPQFQFTNKIIKAYDKMSTFQLFDSQLSVSIFHLAVPTGKGICWLLLEEDGRYAKSYVHKFERNEIVLPTVKGRMRGWGLEGGRSTNL